MTSDPTPALPAAAELAADLKPGEAMPWNVSDDQYHADCSAVGASMLEVFDRSPARYHGLYVTGEIPRPDPTPEEQLAAWVHLMVLEPERCVVSPQFDAQTNVGRMGSTEFRWANAGKTIIDHKDAPRVEMARAMAAAVRRHPVAVRLLDAAGPVNQAILGREWSTGVLCKAKPNKMTLTKDLVPCVIDLKTTVDPAPEAFVREADNLGYGMRAALCCNAASAMAGVEMEAVFVVVGTEPPHDVWVHHLDHGWLRLGGKRLVELLDRLATCRDTGLYEHERQSSVNKLGLSRLRQREVELMESQESYR